MVGIGVSGAESIWLGTLPQCAGQGQRYSAGLSRGSSPHLPAGSVSLPHVIPWYRMLCADWDQIQAKILGRRLAKEVIYKERLLPPSKLAGGAGALLQNC